MATAAARPHEKEIQAIIKKCDKLHSKIEDLKLMFETDDSVDQPRALRVFILLDGWTKYTQKRIARLRESEDDDAISLTLATAAEDAKTISEALRGYM